MSNEVTNLELLLTRGRALSISFMIAEQVPSEISRAARVSPHLIVAFCTSGTEIRTTSELLGLRTRDEIDQLQSLGKGQCIVALTGDRCPHPLHIRFPLPEIDRSNLTGEEKRLHIKRSLEDLLPSVRPRFTGFIEQRRDVRQRERDPNRLSTNAYKVFVRIAQYPETIEERMAALGMNRGEEESARKECINKGYVAEAGGYGRGITLFELTDKGGGFADGNNIPVKKYKSGPAHEALVNRVRRAISRACPSVRWVAAAGATGSVQPDAYGLFHNGHALCVQINCKNKLDNEIQSLNDLCRIDHLDFIFLVLPTKKAQVAAESVISGKWPQDVPRRYMLLSATECLEDNFDWVTIFEKQA
jgi:hypothetical protein